MKREYSKPAMEVEVFEASEYVAACFRIKCNVPYGTGYKETNGIAGYQSIGGYDIETRKFYKRDEYIASGEGCGVWHVGVNLDTPKPIENAMWQESNGNYYPVFHWTDTSHGSNPNHFSKVSDTEWATNPNAS